MADIPHRGAVVFGPNASGHPAVRIADFIDQFGRKVTWDSGAPIGHVVSVRCP